MATKDKSQHQVRFYSVCVCTVLCSCTCLILLSSYMQILESQYQLRNKVDHMSQCELIEKDDTGKKSKEFDINCNSSLKWDEILSCLWWFPHSRRHAWRTRGCFTVQSKTDASAHDNNWAVFFPWHGHSREKFWSLFLYWKKGMSCKTFPITIFL